MKAIETRYRGYRFRSRLEARWGVFFSAIGEPWEYEKEGYHLPSGLYLPDFFLPKQDCWIEIKGADPTEAELNLACELATSTRKDVYVFYGQIKLPGSSCPDAPPAHRYNRDGFYDWAYHWCQCPECGLFGIEFDGRSDRLSCKECYTCAANRDSGKAPHHDNCLKKCQRSGGNNDKGYNSDSDDLIQAYTAAMSARFEHGEVPR